MKELNRNSRIAKKIISMVDAEQVLRKQNPIDWKKVTEIDNKNKTVMKRIIDRYGLISKSRYGKEASSKAWLIVQHFPRTSVKFMEKYLKLMQENPHEVDPRNTAYLLDRVNVYKGLPQVYGSQLYMGANEDRWSFRPIEDIKNVDKRRKKIGLNTLEDHIKQHFKNEKVVMPDGYKSTN